MKKITKIGLSFLPPGVLSCLNGCFQDAVLSFHQNCPTSHETTKGTAFICFDSFMWRISSCIKSLREMHGHRHICSLLELPLLFSLVKKLILLFLVTLHTQILLDISHGKIYIISSSWFLISCINLSSEVLPCLFGPELMPPKGNTLRCVGRVFREGLLQWTIQHSRFAFTFLTCLQDFFLIEIYVFMELQYPL